MNRFKHEPVLAGLLCIFLLVGRVSADQGAARSVMSEEEQNIYLNMVASILSHFTLERFGLLIKIEAIDEKKPRLRPITDRHLQGLLKLRDDLREVDSELRLFLDLFKTKQGLGYNWAKIVLFLARDDIALGLKAIDAYEQAYDQPTNRRLRFRARHQSCKFLKSAYATVLGNPRRVLEMGLLSMQALKTFEARHEPELRIMNTIAYVACQTVEDLP